MPNPPLSLFVLGDSISMHYGPYLEILCEGTFQYDRKKDEAGLSDSSLNLDIPLGPNGGDSRMVLDYLSYRRFHKPIPAGILLLNCGLHDIKRESKISEPKISLASYKMNLRASLQVAKKMGSIKKSVGENGPV